MATGRRFCPPAGLQGLLEPDARKRASPVLRGAGRSNAPGLPGRQRAPRPVLSAYGFCLGTLPLATLGAYDPGRLFRRSPSHVPCKSRRPGSRRLYAGHRLASNAGSRQAHPKDRSAPRFRCHLNRFRRLNDDARLEHAARTGRFLERLPGPHLARSTPRLLPERSPRQSSANAAPGWFDAYPRGADAGGPAILHLSHSTAFQKTVPTSASFCVRDTRTSRFSRMETSYMRTLTVAHPRI